ncbi:MAG: hypothetical protein U0269_27095 [Polyangiales bacterium]
MTTRPDPLSTLFDLSTEDPEAWRQRLALLRAPYADPAQIRPMFVNDLRFGGSATVDVLESREPDPRRAFLEEWNNKIRHRKLWDFARCDPAYDEAAIRAVRELEDAQDISVPPSIVEFATRRHAFDLVHYWQPTNNSLVTPRRWDVQLGPEDWNILRIIDENQGCCFWYVAWRSGQLDGTQLDPPVFVGDWIDPERDEVPDFFTLARCTANRWSEFLLDYAVTGSRWYEENPDYQEDTSQFDRSREE